MTIVLQIAAAQFGNQIVTGSVVNFMLVVSTVLFGLPAGATVACLTPVVIRLIGIGPPFFQLIPFIAIGNLTLCAVWFLFDRLRGNKTLFYPLALVSAALLKTAVLYLGVVKFAGPYLLKLPPNAPIMLMYSFPQLITAAVGGALAIAALPVLRKVTGTIS
jgi:hypothetical protein